MALRKGPKTKYKHSRISGKLTKYKFPKASTPQPPPVDENMDFMKFVSVDVSKHVGRESIKGIQICFELCNIIHNSNRVFVMLIGMTMEAPQESRLRKDSS